MDNLDIVVSAVKEFFMHDPMGVLAKQKVPALTGIRAPSIHPVLQLLCDGPSSSYENGPRAEALRGILERHSEPNNATYTLSTKGRIFFGIDGSGSNQGSLALLDVGTIADLLTAFVGKKFTSLEFVKYFQAERPVEFASLVDRYGPGGPRSGNPYSTRSYLAKSLSRYAHSWHPASGLPQLVLEGTVTAPVGEGNDKIGLWSCEFGSESLVADILEIDKKYDPQSTVRDQLLKARIGQGKFRQRVLQQWRCTCPVTECNDANLLIASHIKRWCDSDDRERLDPFNGLLLSPDVDRLFDKHMISFDGNGRMLLSARVTNLLLTQLGLSSDVSIDLDPRHTFYLAAHRERMSMLDMAMEEYIEAGATFGS